MSSALTRSQLLRWWSSPSEGEVRSSHSISLIARLPSWWFAIAVVLGGSTLLLAGAPISTTTVFLAIVAISFALPHCATLLLLPALIWAPKLGIDAAQSELYVRWDHALVFGALLSLLARGEIREDRTLRALALFMLAVTLGTILSIVMRTNASPAASLLYLAQLAHLAAVFVCARAALRRWSAYVPYAWCLTIVVLAAYGIAEHFFPALAHPTNAYRVYERMYFDGQANHMAGVLVIGILTGICLATQRRWRVLGVTSAVLAALALYYTHSREGVAALTAGLLSLLIVFHPKATLPVVGCLFVFLLVSPDSIWWSLTAPGSSMSVRVEHWREALAGIPEHWGVGLGFGSRHRSFYDNQYVLLISEVGLLGLAGFLFWIVHLARELWQRAVRNTDNPITRPLAAAAFSSVIASSVQGLAAVVLLVTVHAGALYWLVGWAFSEKDAET